MATDDPVTLTPEQLLNVWLSGAVSGIGTTLKQIAGRDASRDDLITGMSKGMTAQLEESIYLDPTLRAAVLTSIHDGLAGREPDGVFYRTVRP